MKVRLREEKVKVMYKSERLKEGDEEANE